MKKILFASDLDNTLIHSYKYQNSSDICVELYQGKEQSFMSQEAVTLFRQMIRQENICFLPVTTRTIAQYQRIFFPNGCVPEFALTTNGYILLKHGIPEPEWLSASRKQNAQYLPEFRKLETLCLADTRFRHVSLADEMFVACACKTPEIADICLADYQPQTFLTGFRTGRKLYFFPPASDKGTALQKFQKLYPTGIVIAAGDSEMDLPMLKHADIALFRENQQDFAADILKLVLDTALS